MNMLKNPATLIKANSSLLGCINAAELNKICDISTLPYRLTVKKTHRKLCLKESESFVKINLLL